MKQKQRYRHKTKGSSLCMEWPRDSTPEVVASRARYVGSGEHNALPVDSYALEPAAYKRSEESELTLDRARFVPRPDDA